MLELESATRCTVRVTVGFATAAAVKYNKKGPGREQSSAAAGGFADSSLANGVDGFVCSRGLPLAPQHVERSSDRTAQKPTASRVPASSANASLLHPAKTPLPVRLR
ncbi:hypothetical protein ANO11243_059310 [Dothideomycetidae sp. 11243]|nr:hypothetical protein ANO11243_059310 [fungal sp. No.11243]